MCILHIGFNDVSVVQCFLKQYFFDKDVDPNNEHQPSEGLFKKGKSQEHDKYHFLDNII